MRLNTRWRGGRPANRRQCRSYRQPALDPCILGGGVAVYGRRGWANEVGAPTGCDAGNGWALGNGAVGTTVVGCLGGSSIPGCDTTVGAAPVVATGAATSVATAITG
jgi:hypothetical protein